MSLTPPSTSDPIASLRPGWRAFLAPGSAARSTPGRLETGGTRPHSSTSGRLETGGTRPHSSTSGRLETGGTRPYSSTPGRLETGGTSVTAHTGEPPVVQVPAPVGAARDGGATDSPAAAGGKIGGISPGPAWQSLEGVLDPIEPEARPWLWRALKQRRELADAERALPPERRRLAPMPYLMQHLGRPRFHAEEPGEQDQPGLDRLLRQALWRAIDALEAGVLLGAGDTYEPLLAEQCAQIGRIYGEMKRRGGAWVAVLILRGELALLRHRGAAAVERLLFG